MIEERLEILEKRIAKANADIMRSMHTGDWSRMQGYFHDLTTATQEYIELDSKILRERT